MAEGYRVEKPEPEFYFHFEIARRFDRDDLGDLRRKLNKIAKEAFAEFHPDVELKFDINLEAGSIQGWIRVKKKTLIAILIGTGAFLSQYGSIRSGAQSLWEDITWVWDNVKPRVEHVVDQTLGIQERIRTERRRGAVARLDQLIVQYQQQEISYDEYMSEATAVLKKINESPDRAEIIPALREYMDARQANWQALADRVPGVPRDPQPPRNGGPRDDAAILSGDHRRRRQQGGRK
jgi:hypothetical protein